MLNTSIINEIINAIGAHATWKLKLKTAISRGTSEFSPTDVRCDDLCEFGKWLYGPSITPSIKVGQPYTVIKRLHSEFHVIASNVLKNALNGETTTAQRLLDGEFKEKSETLVRALSKWKRELQSG